MDGSSLIDKTLFEYTGDIVVESAIVSDWNGDAVSVNTTMIPKEYTLFNAYPNPFNPVTMLSFAIPVDGKVFLSVYNLQGREVVSLVNGNMEAGYHSISWSADKYSSGVYFVKMIVGEFVNTQKLMLVK